MEEETFYFHHSCHGLIEHTKYLIDQQRKLKHVFIHNQPSSVFSKCAELSLKELTDIPGEEDSLQLLKDNEEKMHTTPFVYPVLGVREGLRVNFRIKLRGPVLQAIKVGSFTPNVDDNSLSSSEYHDHMLIEVLGNRLNLGIVQKITLMTDEEEELVVYDLYSGTVINVPLFYYDYEAEAPVDGAPHLRPSEVGLNQLDKFGMNYQTINKFSGISSGVNQEAYLHAFSHQENEYYIDKEILSREPPPPEGNDYPSKISLLNYLMVGHLYGEFELMEGMEFRPCFTGLERIINPDTNTVNIVVFHSSCLQPNLTEDTHSEDMLQFISGKFPQWFSHFKETIVRTVQYNVEDSQREFRKVESITDEAIENIIMEKGQLRDMIRVQSQSENLTVSVAKIDEIVNQLTSFLNEIQHKLDMFGELFQDPFEVLTFEDVTAMLEPIQFGFTVKDKEKIKNVLLQLFPQPEELPKPDSFINPDIRLRKMITKPIQSEELEVLGELYDAMEEFNTFIGENFIKKLVRRNQSLRTRKAFQQYKGLGSPSILPSITDLPEPVRIFLQGLETEVARSIYPAWMTKKRRRAGSKAKKKKKKKQTKKKPKQTKPQPKKKPTKKKQTKKKPTKKKQPKKKPKKQINRLKKKRTMKGGMEVSKVLQEQRKRLTNFSEDQLRALNEMPGLETKEVEVVRDKLRNFFTTHPREDEDLDLEQYIDKVIRKYRKEAAKLTAREVIPHDWRKMVYEELAKYEVEVPQSRVRIGFEIEACINEGQRQIKEEEYQKVLASFASDLAQLPGYAAIPESERAAAIEKDLGPEVVWHIAWLYSRGATKADLARNMSHPSDNYFGEPLQFFTEVYDESIKCQQGQFAGEFVLTEGQIFSYDGTILSAAPVESPSETVDIREALTKELALLFKYMVACDEKRRTELNLSQGMDAVLAPQTNTCGFHVHMSPLTPDGKADPTYNLQNTQGKLLLLNTLLLWCGTEWTRGENSYQKMFLDLNSSGVHTYLRDNNFYAPLIAIGGLNMEEFQKIYNEIFKAEEALVALGKQMEADRQRQRRTHGAARADRNLREALRNELVGYIMKTTNIRGSYGGGVGRPALNLFPSYYDDPSSGSGRVDLFPRGEFPDPSERPPGYLDKFFDRVFRLEFRGCDSLIRKNEKTHDSPDSNAVKGTEEASALAETLMDDIETYINHLYVFFEHAKRLDPQVVLGLKGETDPQLKMLVAARSIGEIPC